jgi:hypothetical protein
MKRTAAVVAILLAAAALPLGVVAEQPVDTPAVRQADLSVVAAQAVSDDAARAAAAVKALRAAGPAGLDALFAAHREAVTTALAVEVARDAAGHLVAQAPTPAQRRLRAAIDAVAMQRDAIASHLYWYTDLEAAKAEAARTDRPILSLRMLGKLNEDLSCANSRFFRTTLYANAEVSAYLRDHFVLHWESVRPVPVITIDMGDGRKVVRTITGNSIHYVLDRRGRVVDGLPGLYGAKTFLQSLSDAVPAATQAATLDDGQFQQSVRQRAGQRMAALRTAWKADLAAVGGKLPPAPPTVTVNGVFPTAERAGIIAVGKGKVEAPVLAQIMPDQQLAAATTDALWEKIAALHTADAALDQNVQQLMMLKNPATAAAAMKVAASKLVVETPMLRMTRNLQGSIALDTVKNEYELHTKLYEWLAASGEPVALKAFNERVYADLFLTPSADPWLGMVPADTFAALDNEGICTDAGVAAR